MAHDVKNALQRAKHKISTLENELNVKESSLESEKDHHPFPWAHKPELKDSLIDMYKANPKVNEELKQRLPSSVKHHCSETTPQLGLSGQDTDKSQTVSAALKKKLPQVPGPPPPPPDRTPVPVKTMEEERVSPINSCQTDTLSQSQSGQELDSPVHRPSLNALETSTPRSVHEDQSNAQVGSLSDSNKKQIAALDKEKNIAFLLKELDSLRDLNKKLWDKLALKEKELESKLMDNQLQETELEARTCERAAALVEEIYKAQRERDQAVMARLRLANEERDEALLRAKKLQEAAQELENINPEESDADLEELLDRVNSADSALGIERSGAAIVERVQRARERRSRITSEEMRAVIEERDTALARCKRLEQELLHMREQSQSSANSPRHLTAQKNQERVHQEELETAYGERDKALEWSQKLEEELQTLRKQHSQRQQRGPSEEVIHEEQASSPTLAKGGADTQNQALLAKLQALTSEHQNTQAQLRLAQDAEREANEKVHKLERLVEVLRKKVGTGSVRTVI